MLLLRFLLVFVFVEFINGYKPFGGMVVLSRREIEKVNGIAEDNIREGLSRSTSGDEYVEPTPPPFPELTTPSAESEIETIRRNLTDIGPNAECNITARYLWDLCRPVLLRTCREQHQSRCRTRRGRNRGFNGRLESMFPRYRPPRNHFFNFKPIHQWFDDQISRLNDSTGFQFSITITNNNETRTFRNADAVKEFSNINSEVQRALEDVRSRYRNVFHKFPNYRERDSFGNWMARVLGSHRREESHQEEDESHREEEEESSPSMKVGSRNPSVSVPKRLPKLRISSRTKRHNYRQNGGYRRDGNRRPFTGRSQHRGSHFPPPITQRRGRWMQSNQIRVPAYHIPAYTLHQPYRPYGSSWEPRPLPGVRVSHPLGRDDGYDQQRRRFPNYFGRGGDGDHHRPMFPFFFGRGDDDDDDDRREMFHRGDDDDEDREEDREDDDDDDEDEGREQVFCREMEENPEVCMEIADRTEKCENELERVCPEYVETRRRIREQLENVFSRQHLFSQTSIEEDGQESEERYRWEIENDDEPTIVIDSISISRQGRGDAYVRARLFNKGETELRVPASDFGSDVERLGEAIGKLVIESHGSSKSDHRGEP